MWSNRALVVSRGYSSSSSNLSGPNRSPLVLCASVTPSVNINRVSPASSCAILTVKSTSGNAPTTGPVGVNWPLESGAEGHNLSDLFGVLPGICFEWFTEGFDTADLMEAKALLDALA
jgi:hypothetical protein